MKTRTSRQSGFSMIELLVTALIFGIGLLGLAALQVSTLRANTGGRNRFTAASLAEGCLSAIQSECRLSWSYASGEMGQGVAFPAAARRYTTVGVPVAANATYGTFDVNGAVPVAGGNPAVFTVTWARMAPTAATPKTPITGMNLAEFVVTVTWQDQAFGAGGVAIPKSTVSMSRLLYY